jgi:transposase-like protein
MRWFLGLTCLQTAEIRQIEAKLACRRFGIARSTIYLWRDRYREFGDKGLNSRRCGPHHHPRKTPDEVLLERLR